MTLCRLRLVLIFLVSLVPPEVPADPFSDFDVQAHRGGRALRPENTLAAFAHALDLGVDTLERLTWRLPGIGLWWSATTSDSVRQ
jgi:glycerophosphoryl diester phosphodiesterase